MNKSLLSNIVIFTTGAALGSVVTWKLIENKYKKILERGITYMSTNTNASNGASKKSQIGKREVRVSEVREAEIDRHIRRFTGSDDKRLVVDCAMHNVTHINTKDSGIKGFFNKFFASNTEN